MSNFRLDLTKFINKTTKNADAKVRVICLDLLTGIVLKTPVDTGRARANWQATINSPATSKKEFKEDAGSGIKAPNRSAASVNAINDAQDAVKSAPGNIFYITNNLPYITRLEFESWSKQAPMGMVRLTIDEVQRKLR